MDVDVSLDGRQISAKLIVSPATILISEQFENPAKQKNFNDRPNSRKNHSGYDGAGMRGVPVGMDS